MAKARKSAFPVPRGEVVERAHASGLGGGRDVLENNREAIASEMLKLAASSITDVLTWDAGGRVSVRASEEIPDAVLRAVRSVKAKTVHRKVGDEIETEHTLEVEMHDKAGMLRALAKGLGLLDAPKRPAGPSVFGITVKAPAGAQKVPGVKVGAG